MKSGDENGSGGSRLGPRAGRKRRRGLIVTFEMIRLARSAAEPLHLQLYRCIRDELRIGRFTGSAARLPSSRALANELGISRLAVKLAFSRLQEEGYVWSKAGSGTFAADPLPENFLCAPKVELFRPLERKPRVSQRALAIPDHRRREQFAVGVAGPPGVTLIPGQPAFDQFPIETWEKLRAQILAKKGAHLLRYASSQGDADLRKAIATYLCDFRAARCHPDQVVVAAATQQTMLISALTLINPGEPVWIEDPAYHQARRTFTLAGARLIPKAIDAEGIVLTRSPNERLPRLIYVTPSHQFPLGVTMSVARRRALIEFARAHDAYIFEDDYDSEFRFAGPPLPCLQGLDNSDAVIYSGTVSKILHPAMRLGYLVVPEQLVEPMIKVRAAIDQHSSPIDQATLARFLNEGFFLSHVKRMRKLYAERRDCFIQEFNKLLGHYFELQIPETGLLFVAWLRRGEELGWLREAGAEIGITPVSLAYFCIKAELKPALIFGFAAWTPAQIREGLTRFAVALKKRALPTGGRSRMFPGTTRRNSPGDRE
jgi:GntR family transcriptional regulator/MocR family aminotransferase